MSSVRVQIGKISFLGDDDLDCPYLGWVRVVPDDGYIDVPREMVTRDPGTVGREQPAMTRKPVVVATPTIMSGLVLRWYPSIGEAESRGSAEVLSASRDGVLVSGWTYLHDIPDEWIADAKRAHEALKAGRRDEARTLATHKTGGFGTPLVPVTQDSQP